MDITIRKERKGKEKRKDKRGMEGKRQASTSAAYHLAEKHPRHYQDPVDGHTSQGCCKMHPQTPKTTANKLPTNAEHKDTTSMVVEGITPKSTHSQQDGANPNWAPQNQCIFTFIKWDMSANQQYLLSEH